MAEPILKWAGGKRELLPEITARFPQDFDAYHEPFVGGGAVFFSIEPDTGTINDLNERLVNFYRVVKDSDTYEKLLEENETHSDSEEYYYNARDRLNDLGDIEQKSSEQKIEEASLLLYLNRTCFNGLYRENSDGEFNVPRGTYTNPDWVREDQIRETHEALQHVTIRNGDFAYVEEEEDGAEAGDLVYFDPPYEPVSRTADFTDYHAEGFDRDDQRRLRDVAVALDEKGVAVVLSNSPPVAELYEEYDAFDVDYVGVTRAINSDGESRGEVDEVLITNVPADERRRKALSEFTD